MGGSYYAVPYGSKVVLVQCKQNLGPANAIPDSHRRAANFVSARNAVYVTPELSDSRSSTDWSENHFAS